MEVVSSAQAPVITSIKPVGGGRWELVLEGDADTGYQFLSSPVLGFEPGALVENLSQGDPRDPGTIGRPADSTVTTDIITITDGDLNAAAWEAVGPVAIPAAALGQSLRIEWCLNGTGGSTSDFMGW